MARIYSILCLSTIVFAVATATDYCNLQNCKRWGLVHTMCMYKSPAPAAACVNWSNQGLTPAEKDAVVKKHNALRRRVASGQETRGSNGPQPPAAKMPDLSWDNELETIAQRWTNQCLPGHDRCRNVERYQVGQNMAMSWGNAGGDDKSAVERFVQMWYDEVKFFDKNQVSNLRSINRVGHYTQVVAAVSTKIGCGRIKYKGRNGMTTHYIICNYGPAGNLIGGKVYEIKK